MNKAILLFLSLSISLGLSAQDLPPNAEPGKCYIQCKTEDEWKTETVKVEVKAASTKIVSTPAVYKTVTEKVLSKEASTKIVTTPAVYKTETQKVLVKEASTKIIAIPATYKTESERKLVKEASTKLVSVLATFRTESERVMVEPAKEKWVKSKTPGCLSSDPNACITWCLKPVPAVYKTVYKRVLDKPASTKTITIPAVYKTVYKKVVDKPASTKTINIPAEYRTITKRVLVTPAKESKVDIPAEYKTITKRVLVTPASTKTINIPAEYKTISKRVLVKKGGLKEWKEVVCGTGDKIAAYNISDIQIALKNRGYSIGSEGVNNEFNEATRAAFLKFQRDKGLPVGGFNLATLRALGINYK